MIVPSPVAGIEMLYVSPLPVTVGVPPGPPTVTSPGVIGSTFLAEHGVELHQSRRSGRPGGRPAPRSPWGPPCPPSPRCLRWRREVAVAGLVLGDPGGEAGGDRAVTGRPDRDVVRVALPVTVGVPPGPPTVTSPGVIGSTSSLNTASNSTEEPLVGSSWGRPAPRHRGGPPCPPSPRCLRWWTRGCCCRPRPRWSRRRGWR